MNPPDLTTWRLAPRDEDVLAAVIELSTRHRAPSTSLITWHLAGGRPISGAFQSAVRDTLRHLHAAGRLACVTHRGTHRWTATSRPE